MLWWPSSDQLTNQVQGKFWNPLWQVRTAGNRASYSMTQKRNRSHGHSLNMAPEEREECGCVKAVWVVVPGEAAPGNQGLLACSGPWKNAVLQREVSFTSKWCQLHPGRHQEYCFCLGKCACFLNTHLGPTAITSGAPQVSLYPMRNKCSC